jgi:acyl carrier protein
MADFDHSHPHIATLRAAFRHALDLSPDTTPDALEYAKHPLWDSVAHMRLIAKIEQDFNIMFTTDQILDISSFPKALAILTTLIP